jgi:hypothetical protein
MPGQLNLSLVLRADAAGFKGQVRTAGAELKELGSEARQAGRSIGSQISAGVSKAGTALRSLIARSSDVFKRLGKGVVQNIGFQASDIAVQLEQGIPPLRVFAQQGSQILGAFGPAGAIAGAVAAGAAAIVSSLIDMRDSGVEALKGIDDAMKAFNDTVGEGVTRADKLVKAYEGANAEFRDLGLLDYQRKVEDLTQKVDAGAAAVGSLVERMERASEVRLALGGQGLAEVGGLAGAITRPQAEALGGIAGRFRSGDIGDTTQLATEVQAALSGASEAAVKFSGSLTDVVTGTAVATAQLREARQAVSELSAGAETELSGKLVPALEGVQGAFRDTTAAGAQMYQDLVGGSYIPDLVTESEGWFERLGRSMVGTTTDSAEIVGEAFRGLTRNVGNELAKMVTTSKVELSDLLSFVDSI